MGSLPSWELGISTSLSLTYSVYWLGCLLHILCVCVYGTCLLGLEQGSSDSKVWYPTGSPEIGEVVWIHHFLGARIYLHIISCILCAPSHIGHGQRTWTQLDKDLCAKLNQKRDNYIAENPELPKPPPYLQCCGSAHQCLEWK